MFGVEGQQTMIHNLLQSHDYLPEGGHSSVLADTSAQFATRSIFSRCYSFPFQFALLSAVTGSNDAAISRPQSLSNEVHQLLSPEAKRNYSCLSPFLPLPSISPSSFFYISFLRFHL
jgi:hypothetical protein